MKDCETLGVYLVCDILRDSTFSAGQEMSVFLSVLLRKNSYKV